jgi:hypothetical protein
MALTRISLTISNELNGALDLLVIGSGQSKSRLVEMLLRENPRVAKEIEIVLLEFKIGKIPMAVPTGRGRMKPPQKPPSQRA